MMDKMILALDPSTKVIGWAVLDGDECLDYGAHTLRGELNKRITHAFDWSCHTLEVEGPFEYLALEIPVYHYENADTIRKLSYLSGAIRVASVTEGVEIIEVIPAQRLSALGLPIRMKSKSAKEALRPIVNSMFGLQLTEKEHDVVDAIAVGVAAQAIIKEREWTRNDPSLST